FFFNIAVSTSSCLCSLHDALPISFFEMTVAMAFNYFAVQNIDFAVVEVGLGGRLDSTNIITPELSVITNIGLDHVAILGDTLARSEEHTSELQSREKLVCRLLVEI